MFNFQEELNRYQESLTVEDLSGGVSGDEVRDILDIAKQLVEAGPAPAVKPRPAGRKNVGGSQETAPQEPATPGKGRPLTEEILTAEDAAAGEEAADREGSRELQA